MWGRSICGVCGDGGGGCEVVRVYVGYVGMVWGGICGRVGVYVGCGGMVVGECVCVFVGGGI